MGAFPFQNFLAAERKRNLKPFNLFSPGDSITWIASNDTGVALAAQAVTGTVDGSNATFTTPAYTNTCIILKNGVIQQLNVMYTLVGTTVTFLDPYVPQTGDVIQALVS